MNNFENSTSPANLLNSSSDPSQTSKNNITEYPLIENSSMVTFGESSVKRPRGRPLGSKNKPKRDVINNVSPTPITNNIILHVPPMVNIIQWVADFAQQNKTSLVILNGSGSISEVNLKKLGSQFPPEVFVEELSLISFTGAYLISPSVGISSTANFFNASLVRKTGSIIGGSALRMFAIAPVILSVLTFSDPKFYKIETLA